MIDELSQKLINQYLIGDTIMKSDEEMTVVDQQEAFRTIIISNLSLIQNINESQFLENFDKFCKEVKEEILQSGLLKSEQSIKLSFDRLLSTDSQYLDEKAYLTPFFKYQGTNHDELIESNLSLLL